MDETCSANRVRIQLIKFSADADCANHGDRSGLEQIQKTSNQTISMRQSTVRFLLVTSLSLGFCLCFEQVSAQDEPDESASVIEVVVEGVGLSQESAQKDAYRNAVRQVVGLYVDSQTLVENDELIEDKILSASNGVVRTAKTIPSSVTEQDGLWRLRARVTVEVTGVTSRLAAARVTTRQIDGESLFAKALSKMEQKQSSEELLKELFSELPEKIKLSLQGQPDFDTDTGELLYTVELTPDMEAYREFLPRVTRALEAVAVKRLPDTVVRPLPSGEMGFDNIKDVEGVLGIPLEKEDPRTKPSEGIVSVLSFWNRNHTSHKWKNFIVDFGKLEKGSLSPYNDKRINHWLQTVTWRCYADGAAKVSKSLTLQVDVSFLDDRGQVIDVDRWEWVCDSYSSYELQQSVQSGAPLIPDSPRKGRLLSGAPNLMTSRIHNENRNKIRYGYWDNVRTLNNYFVAIAPLCMAMGEVFGSSEHPLLFRTGSTKTRRIKFSSDQLKDLANVKISFSTRVAEKK